MDTQHTPGPWTATHEGGDRLSVVAADGTDVVWGCGCCGSPALWGNADADAARIDSMAAASISSSVYSTLPVAGLMVSTVMVLFAVFDRSRFCQPWR